MHVFEPGSVVSKCGEYIIYSLQRINLKCVVHDSHQDVWLDSRVIQGVK